MTNPKLTPQQQVRRLSTTPSSYGAQDVLTMQNRQTIIDALYQLDGRHLKDHPKHGLYTGLWQATNL